MKKILCFLSLILPAAFCSEHEITPSGTCILTSVSEPLR